jgi:hypothetical protein
MSDFANRVCPYCRKKLNKPYWRHIQTEHPKEYESNTETWKQLFLDYTAMGMNEQISIKAICELFNKSEEEIRDFLKVEKIIK